MTKAEAISIMQEYKAHLYGPKKWFSKHEFRLRSYQKVVIDELIARIEACDTDDPAAVIRRFAGEMDDIMCESEQRRTWAYASYMMECARDILDVITSGRRKKQ